MNLLPLAEKLEIKKEYYERLTVVSLVLLAVLMCTGLIPITTAYIVSTYEIDNLEKDIALSTGESLTKGVDANTEVVKDLNGKLNVLSLSSSTSLGYDLSFLFASVINTAKVRVTSINYGQIITKKDNVVEVGHRIVVNGIAVDRASLQDFVKKLQADTKWRSADLPISNLIERKDISFAVTLIVNKK